MIIMMGLPVNTDIHSPSVGQPAYTITRAIRDLGNTYSASVSFVTAPMPETVAPTTSAPNLEAALDALVQQTCGRYRWRVILGHYVFYPTESTWDSVVSGVAITKLPRIDAATAYISLVRTFLPALADLQPPVILGDPRAPLYAEIVSLSPAAPLIEHLTELLGTNERLAFAIEPALSGTLGLNFNRV